MSADLEQALARWGMPDAKGHLAAQRENTVYQVVTPHARFAMRFHRLGYRTDAELAAELDWMAALAQGGLAVPEPVPSTSGAHLEIIDGVQVDVLTWLDGQTLSTCLPDMSLDQRLTAFAALGRQMAEMHQICDAWVPPPDFTRGAWDHDGLLGTTPVWDRFWENPSVDAEDRALFARFRDVASQALRALEPSLDYGLVHGDLVPDNVLVDGPALHFIDFDDGGFGFRLFDVATALLKHRTAADFEAYRAQLLAGYQAVRPLDDTQLDLFMALRAATYVGWNITRMTEPNGQARNTRFASTLRDLARSFWIADRLWLDPDFVSSAPEMIDKPRRAA